MLSVESLSHTGERNKLLLSLFNIIFHNHSSILKKTNNKKQTKNFSVVQNKLKKASPQKCKSYGHIASPLP